MRGLRSIHDREVRRQGEAGHIGAACAIGRDSRTVVRRPSAEVRRVHRYSVRSEFDDERIPQSSERALNRMDGGEVFGEGVARHVAIAGRINRDARRRLGTRSADVRAVLEPRSVGAQRCDEGVRVHVAPDIYARAVDRIERDRLYLGLDLVGKPRLQPGLSAVVRNSHRAGDGEEDRGRVGRRDDDRAHVSGIRQVTAPCIATRRGLEQARGGASVSQLRVRGVHGECGDDRGCAMG